MIYRDGFGITIIMILHKAAWIESMNGRVSQRQRVFFQEFPATGDHMGSPKHVGAIWCHVGAISFRNGFPNHHLPPSNMAVPSPGEHPLASPTVGMPPSATPTNHDMVGQGTRVQTTWILSGLMGMAWQSRCAIKVSTNTVTWCEDVWSGCRLMEISCLMSLSNQFIALKLQRSSAWEEWRSQKHKTKQITIKWSVQYLSSVEWFSHVRLWLGFPGQLSNPWRAVDQDIWKQTFRNWRRARI